MNTVASGISLFNWCVGGKNVYAPLERAIAGYRGQMMFQLHFGAIYNNKGEYDRYAAGYPGFSTAS